jgi:transposase
MTNLIRLAGCHINSVVCEDGTVKISAKRMCKTANCPTCGKRTGRVHSHYARRPTDLSISDRGVQLELEVRRFRCGNPHCKKKTFAERFPDLVLPYAQRTMRLAQIQTNIAIKVGGEVGSKLLSQLNMTASGDTLLRLVCKAELPKIEPLKALGVDDWSFRKGKVFGTILVDLERQQVVDLLEERTADVLAGWLKEHPGVEIISRDRSTEYAKGASAGAPDAVQVADRWHILKNLGDCLKNWLERQHKHLKPDKPKAIESVTEPLEDMEEEITSVDPNKLYFGRSMAYRQKLFEDVVTYLEEGLPVLTISKRTGLPRTTIRRWLDKGAHSVPHQKFEPLNAFLPYLEQRWQEGIRNRKTLYRELVSQGYTGSYATVYQYTNDMIGKTFAIKQSQHVPIRAKHHSLLGTLKVLNKQEEKLSSDEKQHLLRLTAKFPEAQVCYSLIQNFHKLVRRVTANPKQTLTQWMDQVKQSSIVELQQFVNGLEQDKAAVEAAFTLPWSNGQTEGQVNKLKLIKRQMYGRGKFDLLRRRVLLN